MSVHPLKGGNGSAGGDQPHPLDIPPGLDRRPAASPKISEVPSTPVPASAVAPTSPVSPVSAPDPYDIASLRFDQSSAEAAGIRKALVHVPVRKPPAQGFFRVDPRPEYRQVLAVIEMKEDDEIYLVRPEIAHMMLEEVNKVQLYTCVDRQGSPFLWPCKLPRSDMKPMGWHTSAAQAAEMAMSKWVRVKANKSAGAYDIFYAAGNIPDPEFPPQSFQELIKVAFRDKLVDSFDHPLIKQLRGYA